MKKIIASVVGLALVGGVAVTGAMAAESQFGGYWRTRMIYDDNMTGTAAGTNLDGTTFAAANDSGDKYTTDTRTRLYYTAKFNDHFKFVNKFEFDAKWGDTGYGKIGADGVKFEVKNSYLDYTMGMVNAKVGVQSGTISRGFLFADDFSGAILTMDYGNVKLPIMYATSVDEDVRGTSAGDGHILSIMPRVKISDALLLTPHFTYANVTQNNVDYDGSDLYYMGVDVDMKFDAVSAWGTFIYNTGEVDNSDVDGFLVAAGANAGLVHGQVFYASGDDTSIGDDNSVVRINADAFQSPLGSSYYWSEIMGLGTFDNDFSNNSPNDNITNIWAANVGVTFPIMDKLTGKFDVWYAALAEENVNGDDELGIELDGKLTYKLEENLNLDFIFAYLIAGDATGDEDVMEGGVQISLAF